MGVMTSRNFLFADFCLCVFLNNLCTLSVQLFTIWKSLPFVEFAMFSRIFHPRGFVVNFLFSPKISGQKVRKIQPSIYRSSSRNPRFSAYFCVPGFPLFYNPILSSDSDSTENFTRDIASWKLF